MMSILITGNTTLATKLMDVTPESRLGQIEDIMESDRVVIITQGTSRGGAKRIIDRCFTDIVAQIESIERRDIRFIVIGSLASEYSSWPGISAERMVYANAKKALSQYVSDHNQMNMDMSTKSVGEYRIQICEPAAFETGMSGYKGMEVSKVIDAVQYLIAHPEIVKIQLRQ